MMEEVDPRLIEESGFGCSVYELLSNNDILGLSRIQRQDHDPSILFVEKTSSKREALFLFLMEEINLTVEEKWKSENNDLRFEIFFLFWPDTSGTQSRVIRTKTQ